MTKSICFFNHKGGVSKTTTTFNLGWALADEGKKVLMVDLDSQCNLTGMVLGYEKIDEGLDSFYSSRDNLTLGPIVEYLINGGQPEAYLEKETGKLHPTLHENRLLLPGHLDVSDLDSQISVSLKIAAGIPATRNIPGNLPKILQLIAMKNNIDYILYDLSPNVGGLNEVVLMSSDYFIVPVAPDFFCWQAIRSLSKNIPRWHKELALFKENNDGNSSQSIKNAPQFLGMIQQRYRPRKGAPVKSFEKWMAAIRDAVDSILVPNLEKITCIIPRDKVQHAINKTTVSGDLSAYDLAHISDFNSLIAISQQLATPVFSISDQQIRDSGQFGHALNTMKSSRDAFNEQFKGLAQRVLELTK
ncbi:ParA family protein [Escherichia coli]|uniref:ParA family protein n=1 Tax=Escherichia coli TaxID=562 RepID=UPI00147ADE6C|nr:AAA family ATPase [Escherichia coli]